MAGTRGADHVIGVDIGGTGTKGALVDLNAGKLPGKRVRLPPRRRRWLTPSARYWNRSTLTARSA
jgi:predicted NBD/HSP70 family sugar kinase